MEFFFQEVIFVKAAESYVDNLIVHGPYITYHQYDGFIVTLNWKGEVLYETESHLGIVRGLQAHQDILVNGSDISKQLCILDIHSGKKFHSIELQQSRVEFLFVDETKIISMSKDEPATLIGYW